MIIYGIKTFDLKTAPYPFACTNCGHERQQVHVHRTFFCLYHIPLVPFLKTGRIRCPVCYKEVKKNKFFKELSSRINPAEAKSQFKAIMKTARTPFHAITASYLVATLLAGVMTYSFYEEQNNQNQVKVYIQNPTDNVVLIAKIKDSVYPYQIIYIPEIHDGEALIFDWKYGYENLSDAKHALELALNSIGNRRIKTNFFEPYVVSLKDFGDTDLVFLQTLDKKVDWRPFFSDHK